MAGGRLAPPLGVLLLLSLTQAASGLPRRQRDLEPRLRALETKERELDAVEREIDEREDAFEKKIEAKLWRLIDESIVRGVARPDEIR